jgi:hypothetical protein
VSAGCRRYQDLFGEEVVERLYSGEFVVFDIEDGVELCDMEDVVDLLGEVQQFELASCVADSGKAADEFSHTGAVEVVNIRKVQNDLFLSLRNQVADGGAKRTYLWTENEAAVNVEDSHVSDFAGINGQWHGSINTRPMAGMVVGAKGQVK